MRRAATQHPLVTQHRIAMMARAATLPIAPRPVAVRAAATPTRAAPAAMAADAQWVAATATEVIAMIVVIEATAGSVTARRAARRYRETMSLASPAHPTRRPSLRPLMPRIRLITLAARCAMSSTCLA